MTADDVPRLPLEELHRPLYREGSRLSDLNADREAWTSVGHEDTYTTTEKSKKSIVFRKSSHENFLATGSPEGRELPRPKSCDEIAPLGDDLEGDVSDLDVRFPDLPPHEPLKESRLLMNTVHLQKEDVQASYPGSCLAWIKEQSEVRSTALQDGLAFAVEFQDCRPDAGGWIRLGYDADSRLRYSCNGVLRDPFSQAILTVTAGEAYVSFPDIDRGIVFAYTKHTAEVLLPSMRVLFDEAGVAHNIPDDDELCSYLVATPSLCPTFTPRRPGDQGSGQLMMREMDCEVLDCKLDPRACIIM